MVILSLPRDINTHIRELLDFRTTWVCCRVNKAWKEKMEAATFRHKVYFHDLFPLAGDDDFLKLQKILATISIFDTAVADNIQRDWDFGFYHGDMIFPFMNNLRKLYIRSNVFDGEHVYDLNCDGFSKMIFASQNTLEFVYCESSWDQNRTLDQMIGGAQYFNMKHFEITIYEFKWSLEKLEDFLQIFLHFTFPNLQKMIFWAHEYDETLIYNKRKNDVQRAFLNWAAEVIQQKLPNVETISKWIIIAT